MSEVDQLKAEKEELISALKALCSNPHVNLGDLIYKVREDEGEGWDGPAVTQWNNATLKVRGLIDKYEDTQQGTPPQLMKYGATIYQKVSVEVEVQAEDASSAVQKIRESHPHHQIDGVTQIIRGDEIYQEITGTCEKCAKVVFWPDNTVRWDIDLCRACDEARKGGCVS